MIKHYCDRCGKEIDGTQWIVGVYEINNQPLIGRGSKDFDICGGCYISLIDWLGADILAKLKEDGDELLQRPDSQAEIRNGDSI